VTAIAAGLGSLAGASATIVTTFLTQRTQSVRANTEWQLRDQGKSIGAASLRELRTAVLASNVANHPECTVAAVEDEPAPQACETWMIDLDLVPWPQ
jgi:hypothetical protein